MAFSHTKPNYLSLCATTYKQEHTYICCSNLQSRFNGEMCQKISCKFLSKNSLLNIKKSFWLVKVTFLRGFFLSDFKQLLHFLRSTYPQLSQPNKYRSLWAYSAQDTFQPPSLEEGIIKCLGGLKKNHYDLQISGSNSCKSSLLQNAVSHPHKSSLMSVCTNAKEKNNIQLKQCTSILQKDTFCNCKLMWDCKRYQI